MRFDVITLFPEMIIQALCFGVTGRAIERQLVSVKTWNPRQFTDDPHQSVDDRPYGGGPGMVMMIKPLLQAMVAVKAGHEGTVKTVFLSPQGRKVDQQLINQATLDDRLILIAGRYEGVDQRFIDQEVDEEWSIGDYVISGGELAVLVVIDAITRLLPGVLGDAESAAQDSYMNGLLDCPHYTRPDNFQGQLVPAILTSGNHPAIAQWRLKQSLGWTWLKRPDLLKRLDLTTEQQQLLEDFKIERSKR
ncbi:MAG: tRNA (guanosine(37)-N1)-methyltransferase TrmD [Methylococcaceae bacterium]